MGYQYEIVHIPGEDNVWADLLSRWGCERSVCAATFTESPQLNKKFIWRSVSEIRDLQVKCGVKAGTGADGLHRCAAGLIIIPEEAVDLILRLCVVAHSGVAGHQGLANTVQTLAEHFSWPTLKIDTDKCTGYLLTSKLF